MRSIRIVSDGSRSGTKLTNAVTGEAIIGVTELGLIIDSETDMRPKAHLVMINPLVDVVAEIAEIESAWMPVEDGVPGNGFLVWVASSFGAVQLAFSVVGGFLELNTKNSLSGVTHWQVANVPRHPCPNRGLEIGGLETSSAFQGAGNDAGAYGESTGKAQPDLGQTRAVQGESVQLQVCPVFHVEHLRN